MTIFKKLSYQKILRKSNHFLIKLMNYLAKINDEWVPLQAKVFSRWVEAHLKGVSQTKVEDITKDLSNGVALVELAETLTHKKATRNWVRSPTKNVQNVQKKNEGKITHVWNSGVL